MPLLQRLFNELARPEVWIGWVEGAVRVVVILTLAWIFTRIARRLLGRLRNECLLALIAHPVLL